MRSRNVCRCDAPRACTIVAAIAVIQDSTLNICRSDDPQAVACNATTYTSCTARYNSTTTTSTAATTANSTAITTCTTNTASAADTAISAATVVQSSVDVYRCDGARKGLIENNLYLTGTSVRSSRYDWISVYLLRIDNV